MIDILVNGQERQIEPLMTLEQLIQKLGLGPQWVVAELNGKPLTKSDYPKTHFQRGDKLELVRAVSGG